MTAAFPFSAIVGQDDMKRAMILTAIEPGLGGVLVFGDWPDTLSFAGLAIILASGLGSLFAVRLRTTA